MPRLSPDKPPYLPGLLAGGVTFLLCTALAYVRPLFHDEASTWYFAGGSLQHLFQMLQQDVHPPVYFLAAWAWFRIADEGAALPGLRLISAALMGLSVIVFLQAIQAWFQRRPSPLLMTCVALYPFLVFCGYFARYYSLVCLLWTCIFWLMAAARHTPRPRYYWGIGLFGALLFLTNYAAAAVAAVGLLPLAFSLMRLKKWRLLIASVVPGVIAIAAWSPVLTGQLLSDLPIRTVATGLSAGHLLKNAGFLAWSLAVSDGIPPWDYLSLPLAAAVLLFGCYGVWLGVSSADNDLRLLLLVSLLMLSAGIAIGWLLLPGPMYSFLPPRVALCGFAWLALLVVAPWYAGSRQGPNTYRKTLLPKAALIVVLVIHVWALLQMLYFSKTTNWAYQVPSNAVAASIKQAAQSGDGMVAVYLPLKSFGNIRYALERQLSIASQDSNAPNGSGGLIKIVTPDQSSSLADAANLLIVRNPQHPAWPPGEATSSPSVPTPPGTWRQVRTTWFLKEDTKAQHLKEKLTGRTVSPYKIQVDYWERQ